MPTTALPIRLAPRSRAQRELLLIHVAHSSGLHRIAVPGTKYFVALLAWDSVVVPSSELSRIARLLLEAGCVYFCCWGGGCERLHDSIDEEYASRGMTVNDDESTIMTTWHEDETLEEASWFVAQCAYPDDRFANECETVLALSIGSGDQREKVAQAVLAAHGAA
jgi:hypothetical protein